MCDCGVEALHAVMPSDRTESWLLDYGAFERQPPLNLVIK